MDRKFILGIAVAVVIVFFAVACVNYVQKNTVPAKDRDTLYQVSTINALMMGSFDGTEPVSEVLRHGDFGIGTYDGLDGEMIVLDGTMYQARSDGLVYPVNATVTTPLATVTWFDNDFSTTTGSRVNMSEMTTDLAARLPSQNLIYGVKMHGTFPSVKIRAIPRQQPPYPTLTEASKSQGVHTLSNTTGTVIGFYMPVFFEGLNVPGYHFHYISDDKKTGGHVLDLVVDAGTPVTYDITSGFAMTLPTSGTFTNIDLSQNLSADLAKVEK